LRALARQGKVNKEEVEKVIACLRDCAVNLPNISKQNCEKLIEQIKWQIQTGALDEKKWLWRSRISGQARHLCWSRVDLAVRDERLNAVLAFLLAYYPQIAPCRA